MNRPLDEELRDFVRYAYDNAPGVRRVFDSANLSPGDIQGLADLDRIPVTSKDQLVEIQRADPPFGGFLAIPRDRLQRLCLTPGPIYVPWADDLAVTDTYRKSIAIAGLGAGDVVMTSVSHNFNPVGSAVDEALRNAGITVIATGVGNPDLQLEMMLDLGVTGYFGIPSWLMSLVEKAEERGLDLSEASCLRVAHVAGEPLLPSVRAVFEEKLGLRVTNAYAVAELGVLACNTGGGHAMQLLDLPIVQVSNPETGQSVDSGEVGEVVVTSFNETFPLIRLGIGDMAMNVDPAPGESMQEDRSIILVGRVGDAVKVRGLFVHPNQLRFASSQVPGIARLQGVVTRPRLRDELTLRVVRSEEAGDGDDVAEGLGAAVQSLCRIKVDQIEFVPADSLDEDAALLVDDRSWE